MNVSQLQAKARMSFQMKKKFDDPEFVKKHKAGLKEKFDDPNFRAKRSISASQAQTKRFDSMSAEDRKKSVAGLHKAYEEKKDAIVQQLKENWQDPEFRSKQTKNLNEKRGNEWKTNVKKGHQKRANNKEWHKNVRDAHRVYIVTPNGLFDSIETAHVSHSMSRSWLEQRFNYNPQSFYRISKELYSNLLINEKLRTDTITQANMLYVKKVQKKQIQTPYGLFNSINSAGIYCESIGVGGKTFVRNRLKDSSKEWYIKD
jgi:hypothetical protein